MGLGIIKEALTMEQREVVKIFLPYIFLSLPRLAGLVILGILPADKMSALLNQYDGHLAGPLHPACRQDVCATRL